MDLIIGILIFIIVLLLINPLVKLSASIYELVVKLCHSSPVNLREKYGEWAVVTGSTDGIGKEYAKELAKRHMNIVLVSRSIDKLNSTKDELHSIDPTIQVKLLQADFSRGEDALKHIEAELNDIPVGILVNNVGTITGYPMYFDEISKRELWDHININIGAATLMTHIVIDQMKKRGKGAIVNMSSATDLMPMPLLSVYGASKVYITYLSDAIRAEYSRYGITVQCLSPFYVNTRMVGYSSRLQNRPTLWPDAATYAKHAIETLGKLDSTTGYWVHDIPKLMTSMIPRRLRTILAFRTNRMTRNDYFEEQKKKVVE